RPHIQRRFDMPWSKPAARMREYVQAMRAIWSSWSTGDKLDFQGEFYSHTLMTPFFSPGSCPWGPPKVYVAAVGERMTEVAGAVCDGLMPHPFTTDRFLRERTLPTVERGLRDSGRTLDDFSIVAEPDQVADAISQRYGDVVDRFNFYAPYPHDPDVWKPAIDQLSRSDYGRPSQ